ncbi:MAG TPA: sigma-70 family RNA polymerase sigma factor, partial [Saprospiraceae bacterium]|nr:sigma-70 family RNA polymerase sigma factor [Saprospiraceae bacterium]
MQARLSLLIGAATSPNFLQNHSPTFGSQNHNGEAALLRKLPSSSPATYYRMTLEELERLLEGCRLGDRRSQQALYRQWYGLAMSVCARYAHSREEAVEMCNDGFMKVFMKIGECAGATTFKGWLWKIMERAAIDHFRTYRLCQPPMDDINGVAPVSIEPTAVDALSVEDKLRLVQALPPACRLVFNLYAV